MKIVLKTAAILMLLLVVAVAVAWFGFLRPQPPPISPEDRSRLTLMPLPAALELGEGAFVLGGSLSHEFRGSSTPRLARAVRRFYAKLSSETGEQYGSGDDLRLILEYGGTAAAYPSLGDDESYSMEISGTQIHVRAPTETGIVYGLETVLQLVTREHGRWVVPQLTLRDRPRYPWRGLLIDVARHWMPKDVILRTLDAMAAVKLNVLHWHLTEYQGFRVESKVFPDLHGMGSGGNYYTQEDIREVVEYAADRGIRIVPEFDLPGHSTAWFVGYPELASAPGPYVIDTVFGVLEPVMDATREEVYEFLDRFFGEMAGLFPDAYVHIGGDEVVATQWGENPHIRQFMIDHELADAEALQTHFNTRLREILEKHGKRMVGWDEILQPELSTDVVVQAWRNQSSLWESARSGALAILSAGYYLDYKQSAGYHYNVDPAVIPGAVTVDVDSTNWRGWQCTLALSDNEYEAALYLFGEGSDMRGIMTFMDGSTGFTDVTLDGDHLTFSVESSFGTVKFDTRLLGDSITGTAKIAVFELALAGRRSGGSDMPDGRPIPAFEKIEPLTAEQEANLIGGEACMWSEMVDATTLESRVWPRAGAVAEKLWTPRSLTGDTEDMYRRIMILDDRLERWGSRHRTYRQPLLVAMVSESYLDPLRTLVELLEEDKFFNRMTLYEPELYTTTPLNRVVDAAPPESYEAYRFARDVDDWLASGSEDTRRHLIQTLESWAVNHERLAPAFAQSGRLREVEPHSVHLSALARLALDALSPQQEGSARDSTAQDLFASARASYGGTVLPIVGAVQALVEATAERPST